jgi:hypothetical protein
LDIDAKPESYAAWRERALGYLAADRPDVRRLLLLAEKRDDAYRRECGKAGAAEARMTEDAEHVVFEAVKGILTDALLVPGLAATGGG